MSFLSQNQYSRTEPRSIIARRAAEETRVLLNERVKTDERVNQYAKWEQKTTAQLQDAQIKQIARGLKERDQVQLMQRRAKLAMMLTEEDKYFRAELASMQETPTERAKRLIANARQFKEERERKRQDFVQQQYERQWKDGCDDLRTIDSGFFNLHCAGEVQRQIEEKELRKEDARREKQRWDDLWELERQKKIASEDENARKRREALYQNRRDLKDQVDQQTLQQKIQKAQDQKEKEIFQSILDMDAALARQKQADEAEAKRAFALQTVAYNEELLRQRQEAFRRQREEDRLTLERKMAEYKEDTVRAENDKAAQRRDLIEFRNFIRRRKEEEARMERELERLVQEDLDRSNAQRDAVWERERLARERLLADVYATRADQLQEKQRAQQRVAEEVALEKAAAEVEIARAEEAERWEARMEYEAGQRRRRDLASQVAIIQNRQELEKQELALEKLRADEAERIHKEKLEQFRRETINQSKRNYGIKQSLQPLPPYKP